MFSPSDSLWKPSQFDYSYLDERALAAVDETQRKRGRTRFYGNMGEAFYKKVPRYCENNVHESRHWNDGELPLITIWEEALKQDPKMSELFETFDVFLERVRVVARKYAKIVGDYSYHDEHDVKDIQYDVNSKLITFTLFNRGSCCGCTAKTHIFAFPVAYLDDEKASWTNGVRKKLKAKKAEVKAGEKARLKYMADDARKKAEEAEKALREA